MLTPTTQIVFAGLLLRRKDVATISLSQSQYAKDLKKMELTDFTHHREILEMGESRTFLPQGLGAMISMRRTRLDIGLDITKLATDAVDAVTEVGLRRKIAML